MPGQTGMDRSCHPFANSVSKSFGALKVTDNVSFELAAGEALGIIGPNGAGKSTLFNLIAGNLRPIRGRCVLEARI